MKSASLKFTIAALLPITLLALSGCSHNKETPPAPTEEVTMLDAPDGAAIVDTMKATAIVTSVDRNNRKVTLKLADGTSKTVICGPEVVNFNQIQVNDRLIVTITEELAVFLGRGTPPGTTGATGVALAPVGYKPGGVIASTVQATAKITGINTSTRTVTLEMPDGTTKRLRAGRRVDLNSLSAGDTVTVQLTEAIALMVERP